MKTNCNTIKPASRSQKNEKATLVVVIITLLTMFAEIISGIISGSMALLSDGIHMDTHPEYYHELVKTIGRYEHITVEVNKIIV